jgi:hypothetical protein
VIKNVSAAPRLGQEVIETILAPRSKEKGVVMKVSRKVGKSSEFLAA